MKEIKIEEDLITDDLDGTCCCPDCDCPLTWEAHNYQSKYPSNISWRALCDCEGPRTWQIRAIQFKTFSNKNK
jgi:hypothetical protein